MKFLLLTVGLALVGAIQAFENIPFKKHVDVEKIRGPWFLNQEVKIMDLSVSLLEMDIKEMNLTFEGNLEVIMLERTDKCVEKMFLLKKTEKPAEFEIYIPSEAASYLLSVMETDYDNYMLLCLENINSRQKIACARYVRRIEKNNKGMEEFRNISRTFPMPYTMIEIRTNDLCRV
ncbi:beta-lactoglobulin-like [Sminthopsis crassicaudata]|uniref:beta-lactoglobulin-like n=1 Tax=Sminthopsis crassicaudata TaxID=9301 RepID=UPI003D69C04D